MLVVLTELFQRHGPSDPIRNDNRAEPSHVLRESGDAMIGVKLLYI